MSDLKVRPPVATQTVKAGMLQGIWDTRGKKKGLRTGRRPHTFPCLLLYHTGIPSQEDFEKM
jgi:hypothetical protein